MKPWNAGSGRQVWYQKLKHPLFHLILKLMKRVKRHWNRLDSDIDGNGDHYDGNRVVVDSKVDSGEWLEVQGCWKESTCCRLTLFVPLQEF